MVQIGAHMSIAGGYFRAVDAAAKCGCDCVQLFVKNNNQWRAKPITEQDVQLFRDALATHQIGHPLSHSSYLINLASPDDELWKKSIDAFVIELLRAGQLGIPFVVLHPGSFTTSSEEAGLTRVALALDEVHDQTPSNGARCLLETTAGQGSNLGHRFEHLATIIDQVSDPDRLGVCLDTCHLFAAGYAMLSQTEYRRTMRELKQTIGFDAVRAMHLNDSKKPFGSRRDRHEHIGHGEMGIEPFRHLLNDRRWRKTPMYLETPKAECDGRSWDEINLETLRNLIE